MNHNELIRNTPIANAANAINITTSELIPFSTNELSFLHGDLGTSWVDGCSIIPVDALTVIK
jgi:hypothetical protein